MRQKETDGREGKSELFSVSCRTELPESDHPFERVPFHSELRTACAEPGITHINNTFLPYCTPAVREAMKEEASSIPFMTNPPL